MSVIGALGLGCRHSLWSLLAGVGHLLLLRKNVSRLRCDDLAKFLSGNRDLVIWSCCLSLLRFSTSKEKDFFTYSLHGTFKAEVFWEPSL